MARVNPYVQDKLASSMGYVAKMDTSGADLAGRIASDSGKLADASMTLAVKKQREVDANKEKLENINNTLSAYQKSTEIETQMWDMIDKRKQEYVDDPAGALEVIEREGQALIMQGINDAGSNVAVKEKMVGILTNSFRGKLSEVHTWKTAQDTANAKNKIQGTLGQLYNQAANTTDIARIGQMIGAFVDDGTQEMDFNNLINFTYGAKGPEVIEEAKRGIAEAYVLGMLDRGESNKALATLDSGALDSVMSPELKHKYRGMAKTMQKAEERQERMDNMMEIFDIKTNAILQASQGNYTITQAMADNKRITALGGTPTTTIINKALESEKITEKKEYEAKRSQAIKDITNELGTMTKKGKIDPELELKDIIEFQNKVEGYRDVLTDAEYKSYMTKINEPKIKRIRKMGKNIIGMPRGELKGNDNYNKSYLAIYNFAETAYAGKDNRFNAINNMLTDFVKYAEQLEARQGKEMTQQQAQNLCNKVIGDQRRRTNPQLNNLPDSGRIMQDKNGRRVKVYPNGSYEILK